MTGVNDFVADLDEKKPERRYFAASVRIWLNDGKGEKRDDLVTWVIHGNLVRFWGPTPKAGRSISCLSLKLLGDLTHANLETLNFVLVIMNNFEWALDCTRSRSLFFIHFVHVLTLVGSRRGQEFVATLR